MSLQAEAAAWLGEHRRTLAAAGVPLRARMEPATGIYCTYANGAIHMSLPDVDDPVGALQAHLLAAWMGIEARTVTRLFRVMLPRLVAHEIGHALRDEAGRLSTDRLREEHAAERVATTLAHAAISGAERRWACALLWEVGARIGGLREAMLTHREPARARLVLGDESERDDGCEPAAPAHDRFRRDYATDPLYSLRTTVGWTLVDLECPDREAIDVCCRSLLA